ncbi:MAG: hypothetical protein NTZ65_03415 [Candidatus Berkelbacteria bacterium]|nr:hypothetical protein [Candidatus Berkelbacteria bacterium]
MNRKLIVGIVLAVVILAGIILVLRGNEDDWIKDLNGVWVKHGNPANTPQEVQDQQQLIGEAQHLFYEAQDNNQDLSNGPCLGATGDYAVDIAHNPREAIDDQAQNQCADYASGKLKHFIELDLNGTVIRTI